MVILSICIFSISELHDQLLFSDLTANAGYTALVYGGVSLFSNSQKASPLNTVTASNEVEPIYSAQANFS